MKIFALLAATMLVACSTIKEEPKTEPKPEPTVMESVVEPVFSTDEVKTADVATTEEPKKTEEPAESKPLVKTVFDAIGLGIFILASLAAVAVIVFGKKTSVAVEQAETTEETTVVSAKSKSKAADK